MSLLPFVDWCNSLWVGVAIRKSTWLFPLIETVHLLALAVLLGTIVIGSLRLFGLIMRSQPVSQVRAELAPWTLGAICTMVASGVLLFVSEPMKCYTNPPFRAKMACLLLAIVFHFTLYRKATSTENISTVWLRVVGLLSLALWFGVGLAGRAIGFY